MIRAFSLAHGLFQTDMRLSIRRSSINQCKKVSEENVNLANGLLLSTCLILRNLYRNCCYEMNDFCHNNTMSFRRKCKSFANEIFQPNFQNAIQSNWIYIHCIHELTKDFWRKRGFCSSIWCDSKLYRICWLNRVEACDIHVNVACIVSSNNEMWKWYTTIYVHKWMKIVYRKKV